MYTTWSDTCPPPPPGTKFTQTPAHPTDSPVMNPGFGLPTLPPLAKPTLPTITQASPFNITNSFSASDNDASFNTTGSFSATDEFYPESEIANLTDVGSILDEENQQENVEAPNENTNVFENEKFLNEWIQSANDGVKPCYLKSGLAVATLMLCIF